jgi:hypothetical protein
MLTYINLLHIVLFGTSQTNLLFNLYVLFFTTSINAEVSTSIVDCYAYTNTSFQHKFENLYKQ